MPGGGVQNVPFHRLWISKLGNKMLRLAMPNRIYTSTGIFRAYRRKVLDSLELESDGKEIHLEILSKAIALGFRVKGDSRRSDKPEKREYQNLSLERPLFPIWFFQFLKSR